MVPCEKRLKPLVLADVSPVWSTKKGKQKRMDGNLLDKESSGAAVTCLKLSVGILHTRGASYWGFQLHCSHAANEC